MTEENKPDLSSLKINRGKPADKPKSKIWLYLTWLIIIVAIVIGYFMLRDKVAPATKVVTSYARTLGGSDAAAELVASGYVVAQRKAEVASEGTGRLEYLGFEEGDTVVAGQVIARLVNDNIKAELDRAKAALQRAEADSLNQSRSYKRNQQLFKSGSIRQTELENAETSYLLSVATVAEAAATVRSAEVALDNTYIKAPFNGTILTKNADVGEVVAPFASSASSKGSVVTLADMSSLLVEADVSESNINKVRVGQRCEIILDAYPGIKYEAVVDKIVPTADRARATVLTKVAFLNKDDRVLPEMSARINFFTKPEDNTNNQAPKIVVVDNKTITRRDDRLMVFRVSNDLVEAIEINPGRKLGDVTEITDGVNSGDELVIEPPGKMKSGDKIERSN